MILVLGGCGFIGSNFIDYILEETDHEVVNLDSLTYAHNEDMVTLKDSRYTFIGGTILNPGLLLEVMERYQPDYIVNFAAESHVTSSIDQPELFMSTNTIGAYMVLEAFRAYGKGRLHHISTDEVYGSLTKDALSFTEESPYNPSTPYAATKAAADMLMRAWQKTYNLDITLSSSANNYGIRQHYEKLIPLVIHSLDRGNPVTIHGDGKHSRDWLYARDHAEAIYTILTDGEAGEKYNIGALKEINNLDLVHMIADLMGKEPNIEFISDRPANDTRYSTNPAKIMSLGWLPRTNFNVGLEETVRWYLEQ